MVPGQISRAVERVLAERTGRPARIARANRVGGGCVSPVARIETGEGEAFFLKWGAVETTQDAPPGMLASEADALRALAQAGAVRVPEVIAVEDGTCGAGSWLLLEWLEPGSARPGTWRDLGAGLAGLHRAVADTFGWNGDNFIGPLHQSNARSDDWAEFWRVRRLEPQLRAAVDAGWLADEQARFEHLFGQFGDVLGSVTDASLLHGDLWNGNVHVLQDGTAALVDPSVYHGHREVDLAMSELFGGFGREFYEAYEEAWPVDDAYHERRRAVYQLYYLLVHVNLFGGSYVASVRERLRAAGA
ncbi:MAG TPA: fructosamine kinase family protein [Longimicrobiales bacterium]|nr:fructosamine kinase family protein [Longimicrobiales bacterium]